jgi:predicted TIM-barrel fold metal-dependent hydrolase
MIDGNFVIDMQHHYIPPEALQHVGETSEFDFRKSINRFRNATQRITSIDMDLEYLDAAGIDMAVLSTGAFTPNAMAFCKVCNDGYSRVVRQHPKRYVGMIHVYPHDDPGRNRDEIRRSVEELGLKGLALVSSYGETRIDAPVMDPLYQAALEYDMPVFVHPALRTSLWGGERYDMFATVAREYDIVKSFVELFYGVLPRFPGLKVVMAHYGGGLTALKGRLLAWHQPDNIPIPEMSRRRGLAVEEATELGLCEDFEARLANCLFDSAGFGGWMPVIKSGFEALGADHVCFATDYPYEMEKIPHVKKLLSDIDRLALSREDKKKFFNGNVRKAFRI